MPWLDISTPVRDGMPVYPGDPPVRVERVLDMGHGDQATVTALAMSAHAGTHIDAPAHAMPGGGGVEGVALDALVGPAHVVDMRGADAIDAVALRAAPLPDACRRVLLRTGHGQPYPPLEGAGLTEDAAHELVRREIALVGIDTMSIAPGPDPMPVHRVLLRAGIVVVEGLDLRRAAPGAHQLLCLPLLVPGADGAPARALLGPVAAA